MVNKERKRKNAYAYSQNAENDTNLPLRDNDVVLCGF